MKKEPVLVILIGKSGTGKSTLAEAMNCPENCFISSEAMIEELKKQGVEATHDSIHAFAKERYNKNPYWQVNNILDALKNKSFLIYDGPRMIQEVERLVKEHPNSIIVQVVAGDKLRYERLRKRNNITFKEWQRIERDELKETGLGKMFKRLTDIIIENNESFGKFKAKAEKLKNLLKK